MFTIFGRSVSCLVTPKLVGLVRDTSANNINLISSTRENTYILSVNRGILARTMADGSNEIRPKFQNRLALEKSPYLLQHANNPVDWYPWGEEAFAKARSEDRLLFLSVGYATCHWCHVMEHECFENEAVAALMNRHFVNVKVDREERPDVDRLYMTFVQATSGGGGWPMSVWLTPDLLPVFGGTYFPPEDDSSGRPGFKTLLSVIEKQWRENRAKMASSGARVAAALSRVASRSLAAADTEDDAAAASDGAGRRRSVAGAAYAEQCFQSLESAFDARHGGFGRAPKFPQVPVLEFLLAEWARAPTQDNGKMALRMVSKTLKHLALGGVRDHVGEGFARYSVDGEWRVPHFEKMLYDQAQLSAVYASAYLATKDPLFAAACRGAIEYTERALAHPQGGFCSAEDADSVPAYDLDAEPLEGAFYVWTENEIREALRVAGAEWTQSGEEPLADLFCRRFCVSAQGNVAPALDPHGHLTGRNVLRRMQDAEGDDARQDQRLRHALRLLRDVRDKRPRPRKDNKIITAWNGLMISALSRAGEALEDAALVQRAVKAAAFARSHLFAEGRLLRVVYAPDAPDAATPGGDVVRGSSLIWGFLSDYAFLIRGLLDLYEASLDPEWLSWAEQLQETQNDLFWDEEGHGFFTTTPGDASILFRSKEEEDGAEPSSGGVATLNLLRLGTLTGREEHCARAEQCLRTSAPLLRAAPHAAPTLCAAARAKVDGALGVVVAAHEELTGAAAAAPDRALLAMVRSRLLPWRALALADTRLAACEALAPARREQVRQMAQQPGAAFVCRRRACSLPVRDADALARLLDAHVE